jgi:hypothetical protein
MQQRQLNAKVYQSTYENLLILGRFSYVKLCPDWPGRTWWCSDVTLQTDHSCSRLPLLTMQTIRQSLSMKGARESQLSFCFLLMDDLCDLDQVLKFT